jgi:hypothetical protein
MKGAWVKIGLMLVLVTTMTVGARAGDLSWLFQYTGIQDTGDSGSSDDCIALGMRGGNVWPVVFTSGDSAMLLPTGWYNLGEGMTGIRPVAASSPTGQVAVAGGELYGPSYGVVSSPNGWQSINAAAVTFDRQGRLWKANLYGDVYVDGSHIGNINPEMYDEYQSIDIAVDDYGNVGVAANHDALLEYFTYDPQAGEWTHTEEAIDGGLNDAPVSVAFDGRGRPNITYQRDSELFVADFDVREGWGITYAGYLDSGSVSSYGYRVPIECNNDGTVGIAFVENGELIYKFKPLDDSWSEDRIDSDVHFLGGTVNTGEVGLAYDYEGIPVVAFVGNNYEDGAGVYIAYDPIITPEPVSMSLLGLGGLLMLRRRK